MANNPNDPNLRANMSSLASAGTSYGRGVEPSPVPEAIPTSKSNLDSANKIIADRLAGKSSDELMQKKRSSYETLARQSKSMRAQTAQSALSSGLEGQGGAVAARDQAEQGILQALGDTAGSLYQAELGEQSGAIQDSIAMANVDLAERNADINEKQFKLDETRSLLDLLDNENVPKGDLVKKIYDDFGVKFDETELNKLKKNEEHLAYVTNMDPIYDQRDFDAKFNIKTGDDGKITYTMKGPDGSEVEIDSSVYEVAKTNAAESIRLRPETWKVTASINRKLVDIDSKLTTVIDLPDGFQDITRTNADAFNNAELKAIMSDTDGEYWEVYDKFVESGVILHKSADELTAGDVSRGGNPAGNDYMVGKIIQLENGDYALIKGVSYDKQKIKEGYIYGLGTGSGVGINLQYDLLTEEGGTGSKKYKGTLSDLT